jgi:predicted nucleic acid-binding protein
MTRFLVDRSALARMPLEPVRRRLAPIIEAGEAATCSIVDLEVLYSVRDPICWWLRRQEKGDHGTSLRRRLRHSRQRNGPACGVGRAEGQRVGREAPWH